MTVSLSSPTPDATTTTKGKIQLAGDLQGTAAAPTLKGSDKICAIQGPTTSTSGTQVLNHLYTGTITIPAAVTLTGVSIYNGATATGNVIVALFNSAGTRVAVSASTAQTGTFSIQSVAFTGTFAATAGTYYLGVMPSVSTSTFALTATFGPSSDTAIGSFVMPSSVTPPTTNGAYVMLSSTY